MATVFNATPLRILTAYATGKTFYIDLVTTAPAATVTTNSGLTKVTGGNYAPVALTSQVLATINTNQAKLGFANAGWSGLYAGAATPIVGGVICEQAGGSPAGTDLVVDYLALNTSYTPATSSGTAQDFTFTFNANGVLNLAAQ